MAQIDAVMWGMTAAWNDHQYTHLRSQYNMQTNWTDLRKVYFTRNAAGRPTAMNVSASFIKTAGEDSSVSTFFYSSNNLDSMQIAVWDTTAKALKPSNSVAFNYTGALPLSAKFTGSIAMGMSGSFSIYFSYDSQNRIVKDSSVMSIGSIFSQTSVSTTEFTSTCEVTTAYIVENGTKTIDGKDSTIFNASGDDSINYNFSVDKTSGALELDEVFKTSYNANGTVSVTETFEGAGGSAKMRTLYGYGAMPDLVVRVSNVFRKMINKQSEVRSVVNMSSSSHPFNTGVTYDFIGRAVPKNVQPKVHGIFIIKPSTTFTSK